MFGVTLFARLVLKVLAKCENDFGKPDLSCKILLQLIHHFRLVTGILLILSFVGNHEEQSLSFHLVHI